MLGHPGLSFQPGDDASPVDHCWKRIEQTREPRRRRGFDLDDMLTFLFVALLRCIDQDSLDDFGDFSGMGAGSQHFTKPRQPSRRIFWRRSSGDRVVREKRRAGTVYEAKDNSGPPASVNAEGVHAEACAPSATALRNFTEAAPPAPVLRAQASQLPVVVAEAAGPRFLTPSFQARNSTRSHRICSRAFGPEPRQKRRQ